MRLTDAADSLRTERELGAVAAELASTRGPLAVKLPKRTLAEALREQIRAGGDPLGEAFCRIRTPQERRDQGATYTPPAIVEHMLEWTVRHKSPARIVDPGAGSGRFILAAARRFPEAALVAVETDPLAILILRANAEALGLSGRLTIEETDYRDLSLPAIDGTTLFIRQPAIRPTPSHRRRMEELVRQHRGQPRAASEQAGRAPYSLLRQEPGTGPPRRLRRLHHRRGVARRELRFGASPRAGRRLGRSGSPPSLTDSRALPRRADLGRHHMLGGRPPRLFRRGPNNRRPRSTRRAAVTSLGALDHAQKSASLVKRSSDHATPRRGGVIELGEICRVHRGQVTGSNAVWIAGKYEGDLPSDVLFPSITRARELFSAGSALTSGEHLRQVVDLPRDLDSLKPSARHLVDRFLHWAQDQGAHESYVARHRRPWWSVRLREPAPILCTYMARRPPGFARNLCRVRHINVAHGLYPRQELSGTQLTRLTEWLNRHVGIDQGRTYAEGLTKFEPKEVERILIPRLEDLG